MILKGMCRRRAGVLNRPVRLKRGQPEIPSHATCGKGSGCISLPISMHADKFSSLRSY